MSQGGSNPPKRLRGSHIPEITSFKDTCKRLAEAFKDKLSEQMDRELTIFHENLELAYQNFAQTHETYESEEMLPHQRGLVNFKNSCYFNSSLQVLCNIPEIVEYYSSMKFLKDTIKGESTLISIEFAEVIKELKKPDEPPFPPTAFKIACARFINECRGDRKEDTMAFFLKLVNRLDKETNNRRIKLTHANCIAEEEFNQYLYNHPSLISSLFSGLLLTKRYCKLCQTDIFSFDAFNNIELPDPPHKKETNIQQCLRMFQSGPMDSFQCTFCRKESRMESTRLFSSLPKYLIMSILKLKARGDETIVMKTSIQILDTLNIPFYKVTPPEENPSSSFYDFKGAIIFEGSLASGHTYTYWKSRSDTFICYNDSDVSEATFQDISCDEWYVTIYKRRD